MVCFKQVILIEMSHGYNVTKSYKSLAFAGTVHKEIPICCKFPSKKH